MAAYGTIFYNNPRDETTKSCESAFRLVWTFMYLPVFYIIYIHHKHPAGWETARGGSMTSWKYLSTVLSTFTVFSACWEAKPGSKSCYLQWGKILSNISMVKTIFREVNILLEGLEIECCFRCFCLKPAFRSNLRCLSCAGMPLPFFCEGLLCKFKERQHPTHPTPPHPLRRIQHCVQVQGTLTTTPSIA